MKIRTLFAIILLAGVCAFVSAPASAQNEESTSSRKLITRVMPAYPSLARNMNLTGAVRLEAVVTPSGSVKTLQVRGGNPVFAQAAESAVRSWKWEKSEHETVETVEVRFNP